MADGIKIRAQADYLLTEANIEILAPGPSRRDEECQLNALDYLMRTSGATGRIVAQYNQGHLQGINIEQKTKVKDGISDEVRKLTGVDTTEINGHQ